MKNLIPITLALGAAALLAFGTALDNTSEATIAQATADDVADAKLTAKRFERDYRACKRAKGPSADLVQIARSGDYVCRETDIEPTPEHVLRRYAELAGSKQ